MSADSLLPRGLAIRVFACLAGGYFMSYALRSINAAIAGHFGVPIIGVSGDDQVVAETKALVGDHVEGAVVKWAYGFHSAKTLTPAAAQLEIARMVAAAIAGIDSAKPTVIETPIRVEVTLKNYTPAEILAYLPGVEREDAHTIAFEAEDIVVASAFLEFLLEYDPDMSP